METNKDFDDHPHVIKEESKIEEALDFSMDTKVSADPLLSGMKQKQKGITKLRYSTSALFEDEGDGGESSESHLLTHSEPSEVNSGAFTFDTDEIEKKEHAISVPSTPHFLSDHVILHNALLNDKIKNNFLQNLEQNVSSPLLVPEDENSINSLNNSQTSYFSSDNQQFKVHWSSHSSRIVEYVSSLQGDVATCDATLVSKGMSFPVHKIVLASASPFFNSIMKNLETDERPLLIIRDALPIHVQSIITYCYTGVVNVNIQDLTSVCQLGEDLEISGLPCNSYLRRRLSECSNQSGMEDLQSKQQDSNMIIPSVASFLSPANLQLLQMRQSQLSKDRFKRQNSFSNDELEIKKKKTNYILNVLDNQHSTSHIDLNDSISGRTFQSCNSERPTTSAESLQTSLPIYSSRSDGSRVLLWRFLMDLLHDPRYSPMYIRWIDRPSGKFRIMESDKVAMLWGVVRKNEKMNYEKMSRGMRTYYKKGILYHIDGTKLIYKFNTKDEEIQHRMRYYESSNTAQDRSDRSSVSSTICSQVEAKNNDNSSTSDNKNSVNDTI